MIIKNVDSLKTKRTAIVFHEIYIILLKLSKKYDSFNDFIPLKEPQDSQGVTDACSRSLSYKRLQH